MHPKAASLWVRLVAVCCLPVLAACQGVVLRAPVQAVSPCAQGEASYACQVERYHNVP